MTMTTTTTGSQHFRLRRTSSSATAAAAAAAVANDNDFNNTNLSLVLVQALLEEAQPSIMEMMMEEDEQENYNAGDKEIMSINDYQPTTRLSGTVVLEEEEESDIELGAKTIREQQQQQKQKQPPVVDKRDKLNSRFKMRYLKSTLQDHQVAQFWRFINFSQQQWMKLLVMAMILGSLLMAFGTFYLVNTYQDDEEDDIMNMNASFMLVLPQNGYGRLAFWILVLLSGVRELIIFVVGLPVLKRDSSIFWAVVIDLVTWLISLAISFFNAYLGFEWEMGQGYGVLGLNAIVLALRLSTNSILNAAMDSLFVKDQVHWLVSIAKVAELIEQSPISTKHKTTLICLLDATDTHQNGYLDEAQYAKFQQSSKPILFYWRRALMPSFNSNKNRTEPLSDETESDALLKLKHDLLFQEVMKSCPAEKQDMDILPNQSESDTVTVIATVKLAAKLLSEQQGMAVVTTVIILFCSAMIPRAVSYIVGILVNLGVQLSEGNEEKRGSFQAGLAGVLALYLLDECLYYSACRLAARMIANATARLQSKMVDGVLYSGATFEKTYRPGALSNQFNAGITKLGQVWDFLVLDMLIAGFSLIGALFFLALVNVGYMVFVLSVLPLLAALHPLEGKALAASDTSTQSDSRLLSRFQNAVAIRKAAKVGNATKFVSDNIHSPALEDARENRYLAWSWGYIVSASYGTVGAGLSLVTTLLFLGALSTGQMDAGEYFTVSALVAGIIAPLERIGRFSGQVAQCSGAVLQVARILQDAEDDTGTPEEDVGTQEERSDKGNKSNASLSLKDELVFDNIEFSYSSDGPLILKGLSTNISAGSYVAVLGGSGSGKSTLLSLLMGTHKASKGDILMDETSVRSVPLHILRDSLGIVFQETFVFDGSIRDNIAFGSEKATTMEVIVDSAKKAGVHDVIECLPEKYDTIIGKEATINLSGGQLQRICGIARALARKPKVLLLDEATSALDTVTEHRFIQTIENLRDEGLTVISITHHPSTAINADKILVLDKGIIVESGTYAQLTSGDNPGLFAELVNAGHQTGVV